VLCTQWTQHSFYCCAHTYFLSTVISTENTSFLIICTCFSQNIFKSYYILSSGYISCQADILSSGNHQWVISKSPKLVQVGRVGNFFGPSGQGAFPSWSTWVTFLSQLSSAQWEGGSSERSPRSAPGGAFALHHLAAELEHRDSNMLWGDQTVAATPRRSSIRRSVKKLLD
jgi:hypothetical protein